MFDFHDAMYSSSSDPRASTHGRYAAALIAAGLAVLWGAWATPALAQEQEASDFGTSVLLEEVLVTARKREELAQDVPLSVTAYGAEQLEALKVRDLSNLSVAMPNVAMDDIATFRTIANFSIRGLGINSSIPSIDPTVGVFVDGVYMGQNAGLVVDLFDIRSIEVLRGPQGTLFGRNVTGGAILINTRRPAEELEFSARAAIDGNPNGDGGLTSYLMGSLSGPLSDRLAFRLSAYASNDDGWFENLATGDDFGAADTTIIRPVLQWRPNDAVEVFLRWEHLESDGDGPASQNHTNGLGIPGFFANFERDSFDFAIDEPGFYDFENDLVTLEVNWDVGFGDGTFTNIFGWKDYVSTARSDIDAQPVWLFHAPAWNNAEQFSNEFRYNGTFRDATVTAGVYWFTNEVEYHERRELLGLATGGVAPALTQDGGGDYEVDSLAVFGTVDYVLNDRWTLLAGIRYTMEDKRADIASLVFNVNRPCNVTEGSCPFDFRDKESWDAVSGKLGFTYEMSDDQRLYGHWSRSHRSGGYNLRNTAVDTVNLGPGPFDEETVDSFEVGYKSELSGGGRLNAALFFTQVDDMQREVNRADPIAGVVQVIRNTADAEILGVEFDGVFPLGDRTLLTASVGWIDPQYTRVKFDLNGDGVLDREDKKLGLPRAAEWTYSVGLNHDADLGEWGRLSARVSYAYRDESFYTDSNLGYLLDQNRVDAGLDFHTADGRWVFSLYGRNLLDEVNHGGDTQLPAVLGPLPAGGTFSPLGKGRVMGIEVTFNSR